MIFVLIPVAALLVVARVSIDWANLYSAAIIVVSVVSIIVIAAVVALIIVAAA